MFHDSEGLCLTVQSLACIFSIFFKTYYYYINATSDSFNPTHTHTHKRQKPLIYCADEREKTKVFQYSGRVDRIVRPVGIIIWYYVIISYELCRYLRYNIIIIIIAHIASRISFRIKGGRRDVWRNIVQPNIGHLPTCLHNNTTMTIIFWDSINHELSVFLNNINDATNPRDRIAIGAVEWKITNVI